MEQEQDKKNAELERARRAAAIVKASIGARWKATPADFPRRSYSVASEPVPTRQLGRVGLPRTSEGLTLDEPTRDLHPYRARGIRDELGEYARMYRSDPVISGTIDMIAREISRATLKVRLSVDPLDPRPPTPAEAKGLELARRFTGLDGTLGWLRGGIRTHLRESLRARLRFGFAPYETLWTAEQWRGETILSPSRAEYRAPSSVWGWLFSRQGLEGLLQLAEESSTNTSFFLGQNTVTLPASRLLLYTHNGTPDVNPEGVAMPRPAWVWWRSKRDVLLRFHQASEILFGGVTKLEQTPHPKTGNAYPSNSEEDLDEFETIMDQFSAGLLSFFFQPLGFKITTDHPAFEVPEPQKILAYCDEQIRAVFVAQLLSQGGSASISGSAGQVLYNNIDSLARDHLEIFNGQHGVRTSGILSQLVTANIPEALNDPTFRFPKLVASGIPFQDFKAFIDAASKASQFRIITYTAETEVEIREQGGLPPLSADQLDARKELERARLETELRAGEAPPESETEIEQERASEEGTQAPITPPAQEPIEDPDGDEHA